MAARGVGMAATGILLAGAGIMGAEAGLLLSLLLVPIGAVVALVGLYRLLSSPGSPRQRFASGLLVVGVGAVLAGLALAVLAGVSSGWLVASVGFVGGVVGAIARCIGERPPRHAMAGRPGDAHDNGFGTPNHTTDHGGSTGPADDDRRRDAAVSWSSVTESVSHGGGSSPSSDSGGSSSSDSGSSGSSSSD